MWPISFVFSIDRGPTHQADRCCCSSRCFLIINSHRVYKREGIVIFHSSKGPLDMIYSGKIDESGRFDLKIVNICKFRVFRPQNLEPFLRGTGENVY